MMVKVKICGITSATDALMAARAGADALGFNFYEGSARYIDPERALAIRLSLPPFVSAVGLFVDADSDAVRAVAELVGLDYVQLHGHESPLYVRQLKDLRVIKAIRVQSETSLVDIERYEANIFLLDTYVPGVPGGTGQTFDWELARRASSRAPVMLAGGLNPDNVERAVIAARPFAVDVSSGVEDGEAGKKSRKLVERFVRAAKGALL